MAEQSLKSKTVKGLGWSAADNITKMGITFIVSIVLARLLSPDEYGLIGILTIFISIFNAIVDSGFTNALIRKKDTTETDYSTVFYTNLVMSVFMAIILFLCAKPIARFFERPELVALTQVMSSIVIINALCIVQKARTTKAIDFKTQTKVTFLASITSGVIGISMAYMGYGVWALVGQQLSAQLLTTFLFWIFNKWIPRFEFSWDSFKEMWSFGWKLLVSTLINTAYTEVYQVVIGKCYSPTSLGLYTRARQFRDLFSANVTSVVQRVTYPVLSSIQDEPARMKTAYQKVIRTTMLPTLILMIGMAASAKTMILFLIGEKWLGCVPMLQIICMFGLLYPLHAINLNMLQVKGRSDLYLKLEIIKDIIAIGPIVIGVMVGIYAMLWGSLVSHIISYYLNAYYSKSLVNYGFWEQVKDILPSFRVAFVMALPVYAMNYIPLNPYILFPLQVLVGAVVTIMLCEWEQLPEYKEIKGIINPMIRKIVK